ATACRRKTRSMRPRAPASPRPPPARRRRRRLPPRASAPRAALPRRRWPLPAAASASAPDESLRAVRPAPAAPMNTLADRLLDALPQTQCTRCGWPDCAGYAQAIARGEAGIDQCPPGGEEGVRRLAALTGQAPRPLDPAFGTEGPRSLAVIDEAWCIGCTKCL